jgi:hypothetical protein
LNVEQLGAGMIVLVVVLVVGVVAVVVVVAGVSATIVPTQSSTAPSIVPASPVVAQAPVRLCLGDRLCEFRLGGGEAIGVDHGALAAGR